MVDQRHQLTITRQAELLGINHGSVYYLPHQVSDANLKLMPWPAAKCRHTRWPLRWRPAMPARSSTSHGVFPQLSTPTRAASSLSRILRMRCSGAVASYPWIERVWRSTRYWRVHLKAYDSVALTNVADYLTWFNTGRPRSSLSDAPPDEYYFAKLPSNARAA